MRRRQALLVRAVVGSLVLCAALAPHALAQQGAPHAAGQEAGGAKEFRPIAARPFRDLLTKTRGLIAAGELSAGDTFDFTIEADRNADGSLTHVKFAKAHGASARWKPLAEEFIAVLSQSGALSALQEADRLTITLKLAGRASAGLRASLRSRERASELAENYNALLRIGRLTQRGREGVEILNNMAFSANGKQLTMQLEMSREMVGNLLSQHTSLP